MKIDMSTLSAPELLRLIREASAELESRMNRSPIVRRIPAPPRVVTVREPPAGDKDYVLMIKAQVEAGSYVRAEDRHRVGAIAREHPEWVRLQGLPTGHGTGARKDASAFWSARRAKEK